MILIGQFDSPFVRRVGIALRLYGVEFEHRRWSVFGDGDKIAPINPLRRVPTLVLDDGEALVESTAILDHLDELAGPERALMPPSGSVRRHVFRICALASGLGDKAVGLIYERALHETTSQIWIDRCRSQVSEVLDLLERERTAAESTYWFGAEISHADIAVACMLRFIREVHPELFEIASWPSLNSHSEHCEALPVFIEISQPFSPPT